MIIGTTEFKLTLTDSELYNIANDIHVSVKQRLKNNWVHDQSNWEEGEKMRLGMLKMMSRRLDQVWMYDSIFEYAWKVFAEHNNKKEGGEK